MVAEALEDRAKGADTPANPSDRAGSPLSRTSADDNHHAIHGFLLAIVLAIPAWLGVIALVRWLAF
jgi:hypothetical protein